MTRRPGTARRAAGLSLVEIAVVAGIAAAIAALLLAGISTVRRVAGRTACAGNLARIGEAMLAYRRDRDPRMYLPGDPGGWFVCGVSGLALFRLRDDYGLPFAAWRCPAGRTAIGGQRLQPIEWRSCTPAPGPWGPVGEDAARALPVYQGVGLTSYAYTAYFQDGGSSTPMGWPVRPADNDRPGSALAGDYIGVVDGRWEGNHVRPGAQRVGGANHLWLDGAVTWVDAAATSWLLLAGTRTYYLRTRR